MSPILAMQHSLMYIICMLLVLCRMPGVWTDTQVTILYFRVERFSPFQVQNINNTEDVGNMIERRGVNEVLASYPSMSGVLEKILRKLAAVLD